jgi:dipeptidyl aminopeptidase/acylaminoacyl peptidase
VSLDSDEEHELVRGMDLTWFAHAADAFVFTRGTTVFAQRLNPANYALEGKPVILADRVESLPLRGSAVSISPNVMVYQGSGRYDRTQLMWLDRTGRELSKVGEPADYTNVELSKDGRRLLVSATDAKLLTRDIYIIDVARGIRQRFTFDPSEERAAVWSPDDRRVIYNSRTLDLYARAADLSGDDREILKDGVSKDPYDWSPDGRYLLYRRSGTDTGNDLWLLPIDGGQPRAVATTRFSEVGGNFSPDGQWIVYQSDESGQAEIYATRVDGGGKIQVSSSGGTFPRWRGDGREIVYLDGGTMMSVAILKSSGELALDAPKRLFESNIGAAPGPVYDVTSDGTRFMVAARSTAQAHQSITVLHNWQELLKKQ